MGQERRGQTTYRLHPPREVGGARGVYSVIFARYSPLLFFSLFLFFIVSFFAKISTGGLWWGRTGPTRAAIETRDETVGQQVRVMSCYLFSFFFSLFLFSIVYSTTTDEAGRDATGPARAAQQHGTGRGGRREERGG